MGLKHVFGLIQADELTSPMTIFFVAVIQHPPPWHLDTLGKRPHHRLLMIDAIIRLR